MSITDTDIVAIKSVLCAATSNLDRPQQIQLSVSAASANRSSASALIDSCSSFENVYETFTFTRPFTSVTISNQKLQACVMNEEKSCGWGDVLEVYQTEGHTTRENVRLIAMDIGRRDVICLSLMALSSMIRLQCHKAVTRNLFRGMGCFISSFSSFPFPSFSPASQWPLKSS